MTKFSKGSLTAGQQFSLGPLIAERSLAVVAFLVVLTAGLFLVATPRMTNQVADQGLAAELNDARPVDRNLEVSGQGLIPPSPGADSMMNVAAAAEGFSEEYFTSGLGVHLNTSRYVVDSPQMDLKADNPEGLASEWQYQGWESVPPFGVYLTLRHMEQMESKVELVAGRFPAAAPGGGEWVGDDCPQTPPAATEDPWVIVDGVMVCQYIQYQVLEAIFGQETLDTLGLTLGGRVMVPGDPWVAVDVVGVLRMIDPEDDYWLGEPWAERPRLNMIFTPSGMVIEDAFPYGFFAQESYSRMSTDLPGSFEYRFRYFLDLASVSPEVAPQLGSDLRSLQLSAFAEPFESFRAATGVPQIIDDYLTQMQRILGALSTSLFGVAVSAIALVGAVAYLMEDRQRAALVLVRNRGASRAQISWSQLWRGLVIAIPAASVAYLCGVIVTTYPSRLAGVLIVALVVGVALITVAAGMPNSGADLGTLQRTDGRPAIVGTRRKVAEAAIVGLAIVSLLLVSRRGPSSGEMDVLLASVPTLLAVAAALLVTRLLVAPLALVTAMGRKTRGSIWFLGFLRARQSAPRSKVPMVVIVVTVTIAVFTFLVRASIHQADELASFQTVGADFRVTAAVTGNRLPSDVSFSDVDGVDASAFGLHTPATLACMSDRNRCDLIASMVIDGPSYQKVVGGTAADPGLPGFVTSPAPRVGLGSEEDPIPAVVSSSWQSSGPPTLGRVFSLRVAGTLAWYVVADVRDDFPGLDPRRPFVIVDAESAAVAGVDATFNANLLYLKASSSATEAVVEQSQEWALTVESRHQVYEEMRGSLLARTVETGLVGAIGVLSLFAIFAVVGLVVFNSKSRDRELGLLRTLGLSVVQARWLTAIELVATVAVAAATGAIVGAFAVGALQRPMSLDTVASLHPAEVGLIALVLTLVAIPVASARGRTGQDLGKIVKMGDD